jgi:hypothetical protein
MALPQPTATQIDHRATNGGHGGAPDTKKFFQSIYILIAFHSLFLSGMYIQVVFFRIHGILK